MSFQGNELPWKNFHNENFYANFRMHKRKPADKYLDKRDARPERQSSAREKALQTDECINEIRKAA